MGDSGVFEASDLLPEEPAPRAPTPEPTGERRFPCGSCGAQLRFAPGTLAMRCAHCGSLNEIEADSQPVEEIDYERVLAGLEADEPKIDEIVSACESCGARIELPPNVTSGPCPFCTRTVVATGLSVKHVKPRSLLPFAVNRAAARARFSAWIGRLWFAPRDLKKAAAIDGALTGVYLPYWTYDAGALTDYTGQRGEHYYVTETYTTMVNGKPQVRTRQVQKTRWYPAAGRVRDTFDDLLVPGSTTIERGRLDKLTPWDLDALVPYADEYLAGFRAESYTVDLPGGFERAKAMMLPRIRATIRRDIGGDVQRIATMRSAYHDITFKHLLLPVWICAYRYKGRLFQILINARTGEVVGDRPYSWAKITLSVVMALVCVGAIVLFFVLAKGR